MRCIFIGFILLIGLSESINGQEQIQAKIISDFDAEYNSVLIALKNKKVNVNTVGNGLLVLVIKMETPTEFDKNISSATRQLIASKTDPYVLVMLERAIHETTLLNSRSHLKDKLLKEVSKQINLLTKARYPYYNYGTKEKQPIKFISIRSGNDLFTMAGMYDLFFMPENKYIKDGNIFFQRNDDRDYTGSLLIEIGTDFLRTLRKRPLKTYQTLLYGFDVYTPYFKDPVKFPADTSFNILDRPHASFQYFGWSKKGISRQSKYRWYSTIKLGKIGGSAGAKFQNALHQDISYSPRPRGWGAQIANGGRIGLSLEFKQEFFPACVIQSAANENAVSNIHTSFFTEEKFGTYMTTAGLGFQVSNKSFKQNNHNFINHRIRQTVQSNFDNLMYNISFTTSYVQHNTMLEGFGVFSSMEKKNDPLTPRSRYYLNKDQIRRITYVLNTTVSYTTRFATIFYNWKSFSPETKLNFIGINSPASGKEMNISKRWHHFAEIGFTFNVH